LISFDHNTEALNPVIEGVIDQCLRAATNQHVIVSVMDINGTIIAASQALSDISGYTIKELLGRSHQVMYHPDMPPSVLAELWETLQANRYWVGEIKNTKKDKGFYWVRAQIIPVLDQDGVIVAYVSLQHDITAEKEKEHLSITDPMTGAFNRRYFDLIAPKEISRTRREKQHLACLMVDADNFKKYNDTYGHHAGDVALQAIVETLQQSFQRASDSVFRLGGEEFAVLFPVNDEQAAIGVADKARQAMQDRQIEHSGNPPFLVVTLSMGVFVLNPDDNYGIDDIYKFADIALYQAKEHGRNQVILHTEDTTPDIELF